MEPCGLKKRPHDDAPPGRSLWALVQRAAVCLLPWTASRDDDTDDEPLYAQLERAAPRAMDPLYNDVLIMIIELLDSDSRKQLSLTCRRMCTLCKHLTTTLQIWQPLPGSRAAEMLHHEDIYFTERIRYMDARKPSRISALPRCRLIVWHMTPADEPYKMHFLLAMASARTSGFLDCQLCFDYVPKPRMSVPLCCGTPLWLGQSTDYVRWAERFVFRTIADFVRFAAGGAYKPNPDRQWANLYSGVHLTNLQPIAIYDATTFQTHDVDAFFEAMKECGGFQCNGDYPFIIHVPPSDPDKDFVPGQPWVPDTRWRSSSFRFWFPHFTCVEMPAETFTAAAAYFERWPRP
jgi:hypothetical protein